MIMEWNGMDKGFRKLQDNTDKAHIYRINKYYLCDWALIPSFVIEISSNIL